MATGEAYKHGSPFSLQVVEKIIQDVNKAKPAGDLSESTQQLPLYVLFDTTVGVEYHGGGRWLPRSKSFTERSTSSTCNIHNTCLF